MNDVLVSSMGKVGTTMLLRFFNIKISEHAKYTPAPPIEKSINKAVYMFSDPFNLLISIYRHSCPVRKEKWPQKHCKNMGGEYRKIKPEWDLNDYLNNGEDLFGFEKQFYNWTGAKDAPYPILLLRYETLADNLSPLFDFLDIPKRHRSRLPRSQQKIFNRNELSDEERQGLEAVYGKLKRDVDFLSDVTII